MISVCLACYNGADFIEEQVISILVQLSEGDELIISDNGSVDETTNIILAFSDKRIKLISEVSPGVVVNFANALSSAKGEIILLSDQDDVWLPNKVSIMLEQLKEFDLVVHDAIVVDASLNIIRRSYRDKTGGNTTVTRTLIKNSFIGCCMGFRRVVLDEAMPFPTGIAMHDWWIGLVATSFFKCTFIEEKLIYYRRHENNVSSTSTLSESGMLKKLGWRVYLLLHIFLAWLRR